MIGYGHSTPVTIGGKAFCMGYAMVKICSVHNGKSMVKRQMSNLRVFVFCIDIFPLGWNSARFGDVPEYW